MQAERPIQVDGEEGEIDPMSFMKYETIKKKAILELRSRYYDATMMMPVIFEALLPAVANRQDPRQVSAEWMAAAVKIIEQWEGHFCRDRGH